MGLPAKTQPELDRALAALRDLPTPSQRAPDDLIKRIAMDIGKQVVEHIEHAYPQMLETVSDNAKLSIRNAAYNAILAAGEAFSQGLSEQRIAANAAHRRTMRKLRRVVAEAGTKPTEETLQDIQSAMRG